MLETNSSGDVTSDRSVAVGENWSECESNVLIWAFESNTWNEVDRWELSFNTGVTGVEAEYVYTLQEFGCEGNDRVIKAGITNPADSTNRKTPPWAIDYVGGYSGSLPLSEGTPDGLSETFDFTAYPGDLKVKWSMYNGSSWTYVHTVNITTDSCRNSTVSSSPEGVLKHPRPKKVKAVMNTEGVKPASSFTKYRMVVNPKKGATKRMIVKCDNGGKCKKVLRNLKRKTVVKLLYQKRNGDWVRLDRLKT